MKFDDSAVFIRAELVTESMSVFGPTFEVCFDHSFGLTVDMTFTLAERSEFSAIRFTNTRSDLCCTHCVLGMRGIPVL